MKNKQKLIKLIENIHCSEYIDDLIELIEMHQKEINNNNGKCIYHEMDEQISLNLEEKNEWMYLKILAITNTTHKQFKEEFLKYYIKELK